MFSADMSRIESRPAPGGPNEDLAGYIAVGRHLCAWVIDGASELAAAGGIAPANVCAFVANVDAALRHLAAGDFDARNLAGMVAQEVRENMDWENAGRSLPRHIWPIATLAWVRVRVRNRECVVDSVVVGDCQVMIEENGSWWRYGPAGLSTGEQRLSIELSRHFSGPSDRRRSTEAFLHGRRKVQNTEAVTNVLTLNPFATIEARVTRTVLRSRSQIYLFTDGVSRLVDVFGLSWADLGEKLRGPWDSLFTDLRSAEQNLGSDAPLVAKVHDDATALEVQISEG